MPPSFLQPRKRNETHSCVHPRPPIYFQQNVDGKQTRHDLCNIYIVIVCNFNWIPSYLQFINYFHTRRHLRTNVQTWPQINCEIINHIRRCTSDQGVPGYLFVTVFSGCLRTVSDLIILQQNKEEKKMSVRTMWPVCLWLSVCVCVSHFSALFFKKKLFCPKTDEICKWKHVESICTWSGDMFA